MRRIGSFVQIGALALLAFAPSLGLAQGAPSISLDEQLKAQFKMVRMGADSNGPAVIEPGTLLVIQKGGILGVPYSDVTLVPTKYQDGTIHSPNSMVMKGIGSLFNKANISHESNTRLFQVGEKVYPSRLEVSPAKDKVTMDVISCDSCNNVDPPTYFKSEVVFQFAKGYMAKASVPEIQDTIAQVFTVSEDDGGGQQQGGNQQQGNQQAAAAPQQQQAPPPPQAEPQTIQLGQSAEEVQNALGKPDKIVNLGTKQIFVYKDLKITLIKGKVTDVQ